MSIAGKTRRIAVGCFNGVVVYENKIYAAPDKIQKIQVFQRRQQPSPGWLNVSTIGGDNRVRSDALTLSMSVSNDELTCCSRDGGKVNVYSLLSGGSELLRSYGARGRGGAAGQLCGPVISDDDGDGSVLIADRENNRLQVMSEQAFTYV